MQEPRDESWPPALNAVEEIGFVVSLRGLDEGEIEQRVFDERRRRLSVQTIPKDTLIARSSFSLLSSLFGYPVSQETS